MRVFVICVKVTLMKRILVIVVALLSGCQSDGFYYEIASGLRADANQSLLTKFQRSKTICLGERASVVAQATASTANTIYFGEQVMRACMIKQGYEVKQG